MFAYVGKSVDFQGFSGCLGWVFGEGLEGFGVVYWVYNRCIMGFLCMFIRFLWGLCKVYAVYAVYCIFIGGTVYRLFHRSPFGGLVGVSAAGGLLVGFAAAAGGGGGWWGEFERITLFQIRAYSLENRGYFTLFRGFRWAIFVTSGSSIHTQLKTVPSTPHLHLTTYPNGLPNGKTQIPSLSPYPPPNSNYLKTKPYTTNTSLLHNNYINLNISTSPLLPSEYPYNYTFHTRISIHYSKSQITLFIIHLEISLYICIQSFHRKISPL